MSAERESLIGQTVSHYRVSADARSRSSSCPRRWRRTTRRSSASGASSGPRSRTRSSLLDLGLAKIERTKPAGGEHAEAPTAVQPNELTSAGSTMGTVSYMSPEQARGQLTDARSDLFSLGTVLYQMATGVLPLQGETSAVVFEAILNREPQPVTALNAARPADLAPSCRRRSRRTASCATRRPPTSRPTSCA